LGQLRGHQKFLTAKYTKHTKGGGAIQPQKNTENTEKNGFGKNQGFDLKNTNLLFVLFAFFCG
jgi:hypothetical protein